MKYTPLKLRPTYKEYLWGGNRLSKFFNKKDAPETTAESWELADHKDGHSVISKGELSGLTLAKLGEIDRNGFWGTDCRKKSFPIIVKLIDATKDLSIQVHPSDETSFKELGETGKAEMWYIVESEPNSHIYFGLSRKVTGAEFEEKAKDGSICDILNRVDVKKGDVFFIRPGTVHAIGAGNVIAEIQQNSNTTFRIYDYNRRDVNGNFRPLHIDRAVQVVDLEPLVPEECKANSTMIFPEFIMTEMFSCDYFRAYKIDVKTHADLICDGRSFQHLLCVEGDGVIVAGDNNYPIKRGSSYFMPAALGEYSIYGNCRVLMSRL